MIDKNEAKNIVTTELQSNNEGLDLVVIDDETIEKDWGWVFFYQTREYLESGDFRFMIGGNAPYIVNKSTGELVVTGTAYDIEHYIEEYESKL